jgi:aminopeptidase N
MEYPTFIAGGASLWSPRGAWQAYESLEATVIHEYAHQYFYGLLASNEFEEAWLDEGFARYTEVRLTSESEGDAHPVVSIFGFPVLLRSVALHAPLDTQTKTFAAVARDPLTASWRFESPQTYGLVYGKMSLALSTMERMVGRAAMDRLLKTYATEFRFRHPTTPDFLAVARRVTGRDWAGFFDRAVFAAGTVDFAVARAESRPAEPAAGWIETAGRATEIAPPASRPEKGPWETDVLVERRGDVAIPVEIRLDFAGKKSYSTTWNGEARWLRLHVDAGPKLLRALVDPDEKLLLDADRNNNGWIVRGNAAAANLWTARAFFWAENAIDLFMELW